MRISDFNYELPDELIARYPATERRNSRLLQVAAELRDRRFAELPQLLRAGDLLVFNDTRVIPARLHGRKPTGGKVEVLIERVTSTTGAIAHVRASKSPRAGGELLIDDQAVEVVSRDGELYCLEFCEPVLGLLE
jgi:S-adenosylmethionine:tRNA ribosyltransferase-isomerase